MSTLAERIEVEIELATTACRFVAARNLQSILSDVRELERDAGRYRWLRSQETGPCELNQALFETISDDCHPPYRSMKHGDDLDVAIDAAILSRTSEKEST